MFREYFRGRKDGIKGHPCKGRTRGYERGYIAGIRKWSKTDAERMRVWLYFAASCAVLSLVFGISALGLYIAG